MRTKCWLVGFGNVDTIENLMNALAATDLCWFVAHTRPRCEKKLVQFCERDGLFTTLPCHRAAHKYRGKTVVFQKPLFPGYVFLKMAVEQREKVYQSDYLANLLKVTDQELFIRQHFCAH